MWNLEDRGPMMIEPGWKVYQGMIIGEHTATTTSKSTCSRARSSPTSAPRQGRGGAPHAADPHDAGAALAWIQDDELSR
jgi:GTP-binding protein